jgi:hypothetical protein
MPRTPFTFLDIDIPAYVKAKITELIAAADTYAFKGSMRDDEAEAAEADLEAARYNLEQTIATALKRASKKGQK